MGYHLVRALEFLCPVCRMADSSKEKIIKGIEEEFEGRYPIRPIAERDDKIEEDLAKGIQKNLELLHRYSRPDHLSYYEEILTTSIRVNELKLAKEEERKIIGIFCNFVPQELLYACDSIPVRLCAGTYETIHPAEEILPRDICPLIKSSLGAKLLGLGYFELCDLVIIPTTCDGKKKLGEILNNLVPVWMLELPQKKDIGSAEGLWFDEIKTLRERLQQFTGNKITGKRLRDSIELLHKRQEVFYRLHRLRRHNPPPINGRDFLLITQTGFYDDIDRWIEKTEGLCDELKHHLQPATHSSPRLLLTGAPIIWPNYKVLNIVEEAGATIVADELCSGTQFLYEPVEPDEWTDEAMLRAIANRYLLPSTCPCFIESSDRIDRLLSLIEEFNIDGVLYHLLRLCQLYDIELYRIRQVLKDRNIPMITIHTDYSQEDIEQIKTRIEAFLEMLSNR